MSSATPSARNAAGASEKAEELSAETVAAVWLACAPSDWKTIGPAYSFRREAFFKALGVKWKMLCTVDTGPEGTFAHVSVGVAPEGPALIIRRSRTLRFTKLMRLLDRITANARRIGFQGDWRFPSMMGDRIWPAVQFRKQLKDAKGVRREFKRLSALTPRDLLA